MLHLLIHTVAAIVGGALAIGIFALALWLIDAVPSAIYWLRHPAQYREHRRFKPGGTYERLIREDCLRENIVYVNLTR